MNQKSIGKLLSYQPMNFKDLKKKSHEPKVLRLLLNVCDFQKELIPYTLGYGFKNL